MGVKQIITIALIITLATEFTSVRCQTRVLTRDAVASVLQDILSPCNADKGLQFIKMAASGNNRPMVVPEIAMPARSIVANEMTMPPRAIITNGNEIGMPRRAVFTNGEIAMPTPAMLASTNGLPMPARALISNGNEIGMPARTLISNCNEIAMPARAIMPNAQMAQEVPMQQIPPVKQVVQPKMPEPLLLPKEIYQTVTVPVGYNVPQPQEVYQYQPLAPVVSPYLPAASPVSAMAPPFSSMLPPALPTQSRGHFLRKIPIPPPSL